MNSQNLGGGIPTYPSLYTEGWGAEGPLEPPVPQNVTKNGYSEAISSMAELNSALKNLHIDYSWQAKLPPQVMVDKNYLPSTKYTTLQDFHPVVRKLAGSLLPRVARISATSATSAVLAGRPALDASFNGYPMRGLVDSGACITCVNAAQLTQMDKLPQLVPSETRILDCNDRELTQQGKFLATIEVPGAPTVQFWVYVVNNLGTPAILGWDYQRATGMLINASNNTISFEGSKEAPLDIQKSITASICGIAKLASVNSKSANLENSALVPPALLVEAVNDKWLYPNETTKVLVDISTPNGLGVRPGATVLIEPCPLAGIYTPPALSSARDGGRLLIPVRNTTLLPLKLEKGSTLDGVRVELVNVDSILELTEDILLAISKPPSSKLPEVRNDNYVPNTLRDNLTVNQFVTEIDGVEVKLPMVDNTSPQLTPAALGITNISSLTSTHEVISETGISIPPITPEKRQYLLDNIDVEGIDIEFVQKYIDFVLENHDIFSGYKFDLGLAKGYEHTIDIKNADPVFIPQFKIPYSQQPTIEEWVKQMLQARIIEETTSTYNSPLFLVPKKDGTSRVVCDLRAVNANSYPDRYSIRDVRECLNAVGSAGFKIYSTLDFSSAFWMLRLAETSKPYTAFTIPFLNKQYQWTRSCMGLRGVPSSFSKYVSLVFGTEKLRHNIITYCDDLLCANLNHADHIDTLREVANRCRIYGLKLNLPKCKLARREVSYLGHKLNSKGITIEDVKAEAVMALKPPNSLKRVQETCGLFNYFRALIKDFSKIIAPLTYLTTKEAKWKGGELPDDALRAFFTLQQILCQRPVVAHPQFGKPYILSTDASHGEPPRGKKPGRGGGLGGVLSQLDDQGVERVVGYWSRGLKDSECNFSAYSLEMSALVGALEYFNQYTRGSPVTAIVDHKPIVAHSYRHAQTLSALQQRLNEYDVTVIYREGKNNGAADCLSRNPICTVNIEAIAPHTSATLLEAQGRDETVIAIKNYLNDKTLPSDQYLKDMVAAFAPKASISDGLLYIQETRARHWPKLRVWVPKELRQSVIAVSHDPSLSGHWGPERTTQKVLQDHTWPTVAVDVMKYIEKCAICFQKSDMKAKKAQVGLTPWPQARGFNDRVHGDLCGPFLSKTVNKYVFVITDAYSKWVELVAIPDKKATTVARAFFDNWICRYSVPLLLITDNGGEFANQIMSELINLFQVQHHTINSYLPRSNGAAEKFNSSMRGYLLSFIDNDTLNWEEFLPSLQFASNTAVNASTKMTPFFALFAHDPTLPWALTGGGVPKSASIPGEMFRTMLEANKIISANNEETRRAYEAYFAQKVRKKSFEVGDKVLLYDPKVPQGVNKKLYRPWKGGYRVTKLLDFNTCLIVKYPDTKEIPMSYNRLRLFNEFKDPYDIEVDMAPPGQPEGLPQKKPKPIALETSNSAYFTRSKAREALKNEGWNLEANYVLEDERQFLPPRGLDSTLEQSIAEENAEVANEALNADSNNTLNRSLNDQINDDTVYNESAELDGADNISLSNQNEILTEIHTPPRSPGVPPSGPSSTSTPKRPAEVTTEVTPEVSSHSSSGSASSNNLWKSAVEAVHEVNNVLTGGGPGPPVPQCSVDPRGSTRVTRNQGKTKGTWSSAGYFKLHKPPNP